MNTQNRLPQLDEKRQINHSPHVVILGAGASKAACPKGDKNGKPVPLMDNLIETLELEPLLMKYGLRHEPGNFEEKFSRWSQSKEHQKLVGDLEKHIHSYFSELELPENSTVYDYLVLSLRQKDIIATFNWDPFLSQAYKRIGEHIGFENLPHMAFLHGNAAIGYCREHMVLGPNHFTCNICGKPFEPTNLLYPVEEKNYSNDFFIDAQWKTLRDFIQDSYFVTIFGYSAPESDRLAKELMLSVWDENPTKRLAEIEIIDTKSDRELEATWEDFFVSHHYMTTNSFFNSYLSRMPRRSCDAFAMATLQLEPWHDNFFPEKLTINELVRWIEPLINEEKEGEFTGAPCKPL